MAWWTDLVGSGNKAAANQWWEEAGRPSREQVPIVKDPSGALSLETIAKQEVAGHNTHFNSYMTDFTNMDSFQNAVQQRYNQQTNPNFQLDPVRQAAAQANQADVDSRWTASQQDDGGMFGDLTPLLMGAGAFFGAPLLAGAFGGGLAGSLGAGALIGGAGGAVTGGDPFKSALFGAAGAGLGNYFSGAGGFDPSSIDPSTYDSWSGGDWTMPNSASAGATGGGMDFPIGNYDPSNPLGLGGGGSLDGLNLGSSLGTNGNYGEFLTGAPGASTGNIYLDQSLAGTLGTSSSVPNVASGFWDVVSKYGSSAVSAVQKLIGGGGNMDDLMKLLGKVAPAALGAIASNQQSKDYRELADKYMAFGAPSRARYEASFLPGFSMEGDPGYKDALDQTTKSFLHKASVTGNPVDSPNAWTQTLKDVNSSFAYPALQNFRTMNAGAGGLANMTPAAINAGAASINAGRGVYDAIGAGAADIFNPPKSLEEVLKGLKGVTV